MDQELLRQTFEEINERECAFEKALLAGYCTCTLATKILIAEREGIHCRTDDAQAECLELLELLRQQSRFTLKTPTDAGVLPHAKKMRIQVGGLRGIHCALYPDQPVPEKVEDVNGLLAAAREQYGELEELPFREIIQQIAAYRPREGRNR